MEAKVRVIMMPKDTNHLGNIFGGVILSYIDLAAAEQARDVAPEYFVTKILREVNFIAPVNVGDSVTFYTEVVSTGRTSVTVKVLVEARRGKGREKKVKVTEAEVVMVAVDDRGKPISLNVEA